ncbi:hypothetical protein FA15DRAFT_663038 [Coprinopsis marcescibilis]|uniref:Large ribosomal subunit protein mL49 n=1 Tax=Coprinopsis marcescibilis TaxID=230819 RepID=A0A5C3LAA7_COPMA|nr:hypothetical protein FA15DRAFT_663038 [Coprinopsis marcescibilis]
MLRLFSRAAAAQAVKYPYFVPRNTNGNLPVYSDIRNAGTRLVVQVRNVDGNVNALADDLSQSLFKAGSAEARRVKIRTNHQHVVISGGRWKQDVVEWLKNKGF